MKISVLTMFPELFPDFLREPVIARARGLGKAEISIVDIKAFAGGSFRRIDDDTYGGGAGMVMRALPILRALESVKETGANCHTIYLTPSGVPYTQKKARELSSLPGLVLLCGHYEGIDARVLSHVDEEISIGDYVLTGGELPAKVVLDSVIRLLPGVLREESTREESFENGLLEYPQDTKPADLNGDRIPEVLLSGDHEKIRLWRLRASLKLTLRHRPDLLENRVFTEEERKLLREIQEEMPGGD